MSALVLGLKNLQLLAQAKIPTCINSLGSLNQLRSATKKSGGSSRNGRDSAGRRLGAKRFDGSDLFILVDLFYFDPHKTISRPACENRHDLI